MEEDKEEVKTMVSSQPETDIQLTNVDVKQYSSPNDLETFYVKLTDLLDSSGYNLILNVRKTCLDLYLFYMEVTKRGGYHQVRKEKKWGEIVSALKLEGNNARLCTQVQKLYGKLLYKFEKLYFYRFPASQTASGSTKAKRKQGSTSSLSQLVDDGDYPTAAEISKDCPINVTAIPEVQLQTPSKDKEKKKKRGCPTGRSGYQIFLKQECARLKASGQDIDGKHILRVAVEEWNKLSDIDKQPYVEESKKMKEQKKEAMMTENNKQKSTLDLNKDEKKANLCCGDYYCVTLQPQANNPLVNNAAVDLAYKMTEKTSKDPFFPFDLDAYRSVDLLTGLAIGEPK
ncbi:high mobility group B protein 10-like [Vicia villosa]|uniref:high mobility group B protein 10-like n=1 Tax=Vicia villosa TaxID=3911 RepID=UPI00273C9C26|nr:high mobility group B protein 10-like [Vicia villosa]